MGQGIHVKAAQVAVDTLNELWADDAPAGGRVELSMVRFAERDTLVLPRANVSQDKPEYRTVQQALGGLELPPAFADILYGSAYCTRFGYARKTRFEPF